MSIIAIDLGSRRIGIATTSSGSIASPHSVMKNEGDVVQKITRIGEELEATEYVVGLPKRTHASASDAKYHQFADALRQRSCKPVTLWDESLSTVEAAERLRSDGLSRRESRERIDMVAAAVILQSFLDGSTRRSS